MSVTTTVAVARPGSEDPSLEFGILPELVGHRVQIAITATGVCQSQLHQLRNAAVGMTGTGVRALGHEAVGVVEATGAAVDSVHVGQHVLVTWIPDARAARARAIESASVRLADGTVAESPDVFTWATRAVVDEAFLFGLDSEPSPALAIVGCAVPTGAGAVLHTGEFQPGQRLAVIGIGGVGINAIAAAKAAGASAIAAFDIDRRKLAYAREFGATVSVDTSSASAPTFIESHELRASMDVVVDCVAAQATLDLAMSLVRIGQPGVRGGTVVEVGVARDRLAVDVRAMQLHEQRLLGSFGGSTVVARDLPEYVAWARDGRLDLDAMVSRTYTLEQLDAAVDDLRHGRILGRGIVLP